VGNVAEAVRRVREAVDPVPPGFHPAMTSRREGRTVCTRYGAGIGSALAVECESDEAAYHWDVNGWTPMRH
jgi:hypothetical protein